MTTRYIFFLMVFVLCLFSCKRVEDVKEGDILVTVGTEKLSKSDVIKVVPTGLSKTDSLQFVESYINNWIDSKLLSEVAVKNIPSMDNINKLVDEYRNQLIMYEYRKNMVLSNESLMRIPEDSIKAYYERNKADFLLDQPIVKGIYIKIATDAKNLNDVRKWIKNGKPEDIDKIEKYGLNGAIHYDYFKDKWVKWVNVEKNIPYYFEDPNKFVKDNNFFEVTEKGFVYLLNITEYKEKGDIMPYDFAKQQIKEIFVNSNQRQYDAHLKKTLYQEAIESGELVRNKIK